MLLYISFLEIAIENNDHFTINAFASSYRPMRANAHAALVCPIDRQMLYNVFNKFFIDKFPCEN